MEIRFDVAGCAGWGWWACCAGGGCARSQVAERASRRTYTATYKLEILREYERLDKAGKGALLRREGLYTSLISAWREQRDKGALEALSAVSRGPKPVEPQARENERLVAENARLA